jgi:diguanylate cyclase (GGDEF)-like protein
MVAGWSRAEGVADSILIVATARTLRRRLFDALDHAGCAPIHCARNATHAATLLQDQPAVDAMIVATGAEPAQLRDTCAQLRRLDASAEAALLVIVEDGMLPAPGTLPVGTLAWLQTSQIESELLPRWQQARLQRTPPGHSVTDPTAVLNLLARLHAAASGVDAQEAAARLLLDGLDLDYLALWSARGQDSAEPVQLLQHWRGNEPGWVPPPHGCLQCVLGGKPLLYPVLSERVAQTDALLKQLALVGFAGLPLLDDRRNVIGALLAGRLRPLADMDILAPALRCAAALFAHGLELQRTREQGRSAGLLDALTALPNRLLFQDRLATILREATRNGESFAVLLVDVDHLQAINDRHGHAAGDAVLRTVAQRVCTCIRASDTVARYAGGEFTVILRHMIRTEDVLRIADKIVQARSPELRLDGGAMAATVSVGISLFPDDAGDADTLLAHADAALHVAKRLGRDNFQVYANGPGNERRQGVALRSRLRHAQEHGELRVVYQPQVETCSEDIVGMEALVRWEHPELGLVSPATFIPLAEETGLIVSIGEWVLRTACQQAQVWQQRYGLRLRLGVNLSAVQLMQPTLVQVVASALRDTGLDPALLELEITESISIKTVANLVENLHALHNLGCRIAIDDFGTGAASLDYLRRLPADRIKVDQSFVRNIGIDPDDEAIVRATIDMAHRLKRAVVAEGVETEQHLQFLRAEHCDELQGYLFARPLQAVSFDTMLAERERLLRSAVAQPA